MRYAALISREGKYTLAEFPDCGGCQTFVKGKKPIEPMAQEALEGWLIRVLKSRVLWSSTRDHS